MIKIHKIITGCLVGTMVWSFHPVVTEAAEMPIAGIDLVIDDFYENNENSEKDITKYLETLYRGISFAKVTNYVNIRSKANEESEILGKLYNNCAATIIDKKDDWYQVKSGSVTGYIKADYLIIGEQAEELSTKLGYNVAKITASALKVRKEASTESDIITLLPVGEELKVLKQQDGWAKVFVDNNTTGYVSTDYVKVSWEYEEAVSIQEERERLEEEEASSEVQTSGNSGSGKSKQEITLSSNASDTSGTSSLRSNIINYAKRFLGNPYEWGGTSLTNGTDCSGFTQSVLENYGIYIPRTSRAQASSGRRVSVSNIKPGDLVFYSKNGTINHVALYIGNGRVISASSPSTGIRITDLYYRTPVKAVNYID
ncbi:MAG: hypothetical protein K0S76_2210 [Herbinix sp.]|jgi:cell wall-associated NlpC family hydrolase|nr:hypothetical protein [Herbinix sp.]